MYTFLGTGDLLKLNSEINYLNGSTRNSETKAIVKVSHKKEKNPVLDGLTNQFNQPSKEEWGLVFCIILID